MKILLACSFVLLVLSGVEVKAQIEKGTQLWGGTISASGNTQTTEHAEDVSSKSNQHRIGLGVQWGTFVKSNFMVGVGVDGYLNPLNNVSGTYELKNNSYSYGLTPFVRWYKPVIPRLSIFVEPSVNVLFSTQQWRSYTANVPSEKSSSSGFSTGIRVRPGISYRIGERFALESDLNIFSLGLNYSGGGSSGSQAISFVSSFSSGITSLFSLRAAFYLN